MRARIEAAIQKKVEGQEISVSEIAPEVGGKVIDLMEALRASLEKTESPRAGQPAARARARRPSASKQAGQASARKAGRR